MLIRRRYFTHNFTHDRAPFIVRSATAEDAEGALALMRESAEEGVHALLTLPELEADAEEIRGRLTGLLARENSLWIVAEQDGAITGSLCFENGSHARTRHAGRFEMEVSRERRGRGVESALIETLLLWARENPAIARVAAEVRANDAYAIEMLARFAFEQEGCHHRAYRAGPERFLDALTFAKWVG